MANIQYKVSSADSQYLEPVGSGSIDVVADMSWTLTPKSGRINVPKMYVREYQITAGQLIASLTYIYKLGLKGANNLLTTGTIDAADLYRFKYLAKETGFSYVFPYFSTNKHTRQTGFGGEDAKSIFSEVEKMGSNLLQGFQSKTSFLGHGFKGVTTLGTLMSTGENLINKILPGKLNLDLPQQWTGTSEGSYTVTFDLFNTGSIDELWNNRNLCYILTYQNTQSRRNAMITDPVCIYDIHCGDIVHMPAAYIDNLSITNLGNTRSIQDAGGVKKIIPEAYRISLSFKSLLQPSRQIMNGLDTGERVEAIGFDDSLQQATANTLNELLAGRTNTVSGRAREITNGFTLQT